MNLLKRSCRATIYLLQHIKYKSSVSAQLNSEHKRDTNSKAPIFAVFLVVLSLCFGSPPITGKVITAASGTTIDIQNAVDLASTGDTVRIPEGEFLFDGTVTVAGGISIIGAGRNNTILRKIGISTVAMFRFDGSNGEQFRFSGIKLIGLGDGITQDKGLDLQHDCKDFRIFDNNFENFGHSGIIVRGNARGLIDHNYFVNCYMPGLGYGVEVIGDGDASWERSLNLGTENAVFVEDNQFLGSRHSIASSYGSRYVFRYNICIDNKTTHAAVDAHGKGTWERGSRSYEIYENTLIDCPDGIGIRGGDGVIFNNEMTGNTVHAILLTNDSSPACSNWPCPDQIRGLYMWNNIDNGTLITDPFIEAKAINILQEGRDYFFYQKPGYSPYVYPHPLIATSSPRITLNASPTTGSVPLTVTYTADTTGGTSPYNYSWDFGDRESSDEQNPSHTYTSIGNYTVTLTVTDSANEQATDSVVIKVSEATSPIALSISASPTLGQAPLSVNFTASVSGGRSPYSYNWNFGDGNSSSEKNPTHTYSTSGEYSVIFTATDSAGSKATASLTISATSNPTYNLTISSITGSPAPGSGGTTNPQSGNYSYSMGSSVQVIATPNTNYRFAKWTGDVNSTQAYNGDITITMDNDKSLSAHFFTKCGDVNGDLSVSPADAQAAFNIFLGRISNATEAEKENADVNCDGTSTSPNITPADAHAIFEKFIGKKELPCDCSCKSRSSSLSFQSEQAEDIFLTINEISLAPGDEIIVPITVNKPLLIDAFGFDLLYPADILEFIGVEKIESNGESYYVDAIKISEEAVRAGGYRDTPITNNLSPILIKFVFKTIGEPSPSSSFTIINTVDDVKNASFRNGRIKRRPEKPEYDRE